MESKERRETEATMASKEMLVAQDNQDEWEVQDLKDPKDREEAL